MNFHRSKPAGVPKRVVSDTGDQSCAHWVGDDVSRNLFQIFFAAECMVMKPILPDAMPFLSAHPVDVHGAVSFGLADDL